MTAAHMSGRGAIRPQWEILMTPEERQMLSGLFDRIRDASSGPKDQEAESFIGEAMRNTPAAGYVLAQTVLVQQQALEAAARHISELEARAKSDAQPQQEGSFLGNLGRSLFGGGSQAAPPPPAQRSYDARAYERDAGPAQANPPQRQAYAPPPPSPYPPSQGYAPPPQGGPWSGGAPQGGGFLSGALQTATGVAGGVLLGNALGGLFGGHGGGGGLFGGGFGGGGLGEPRETVNETVNNYYDTDPAGQHAQDVLQDQDQDQDAAQDAADYSGGDDDFSGGGGDDYA